MNPRTFGSSTAYIRARLQRGWKKPLFAALVIIGVCWTFAGAETVPTKVATSRPATSGAEDPQQTGQSDETSGTDDLGQITDGDELLLFKDMPTVISASRKAQPINWLSVPVSIITAEDIHYSGLTKIDEILQFTPSVDLLRFDRNRYAVGVRGMHDLYSDRVLSLVDGRAADSTIFGGPELHRLPVLLEDIKRIEIVRGPGGAAWGANAFTGVINIITKDPEDCLGWLGTTTWNHFGDSYSHARWAAKDGKWSWRLSMGYAGHESSDDAIDGTADFETSVPALARFTGFRGYESRDFSRDWRFDGKFIYRLNDQTKWSFGGGHTNIERGDYEDAAYFPEITMRLQTTRAFARMDREFADGRHFYLQWFGNFDYTKHAAMKYHAAENDIEGQYNFKLGQKHQASVGGNIRWDHINTHWSVPQHFRCDGEPFDEYWAGLFAIDRWEAADRLVIEGQIRGDYYSETQMDWSGRLSGLYSLDEKNRHVVRLSTAKAFRAPLVSSRRLQVTRVPMGTGAFLYNILRPDDVRNEETWSLEAGYTGRLNSWLTVRGNAYFQRYDNLIGYNTTTAGIVNTITPDNIDGANSFGGEIELEVKGKAGKLSAWYAYNDFQEDMNAQSVRSFLPSKHKVGLTGRLFLPDDWVLNANYKYTNLTPGSPSGSGSSNTTHRLDLTVSKEVFDGHGEIMFGVSDVLYKTHEAVFNTTAFAAHETPGRAFFARLQFKF
ncbi:MAG: TonB-dependent receptor plug domain-containing protein [Planctomycetota bacterium]|nr:TonB-dependent receptor plug domain-containing protein [Planctomycetota bacterium]